MSRKAKGRSAWIPMTIQPVRVGSYECNQCKNSKGRLKKHIWDGKHWFVNKTQQKQGVELYAQGWSWRGLDEDPDEGKALFEMAAARSYFGGTRRVIGD